MERIDTHQHFWKYTAAEFEWIGEQMKTIRRDFLPEDLKKEIERAGVSSVIAVQARQTLEETHSLLHFADTYTFIKGVVGWVPLTAPDLSRLLPTVAAHPKLRGVRHIVQDEPDPDYILGEEFNHGIGALRAFELAYDILIYEHHLPQTIRFVDRHPNQVFILDHLAKPRVKENQISPWRENIQELALRPNVYCKISSLATQADYTNWTEGQLRPYIDVVLSAFTPKRLMFGSDWPVCLLAINYSQWVRTVANAIASLSASEQQQIWSETAREAYRLGE